MTGTEIYQRTTAYEREARTICLLAPHWKLLLAFDGVSTLAEVALHAEISFAEAFPLAEKFLARGWIEEQPITLEQYLKRTGTPDLSAPVPSVPPPAVVAEEPKTESVLPLVLPAVSTPAPVPAHVTPPALPTRVVRVPHGPMRLSAVVDYITSLVGNTALGQLLVYRVFLRVPPELLQAEDIASVHLVNDTSLIRGLDLQKAIANAVLEVARRPLPDGVFAPA